MSFQLEHIEEVVPGGLQGDFCKMTYGCSAVALVAGAGRINHGEMNH